MKTLKEFKQYFNSNIDYWIELANNSEPKGCLIILPHYSINTVDFRGEQLNWYWDAMEAKHGIVMEVTDYDDLVLYTDQYKGIYNKIDY